MVCNHAFGEKRSWVIWKDKGGCLGMVTGHIDSVPAVSSA